MRVETAITRISYGDYFLFGAKRYKRRFKKMARRKAKCFLQFEVNAALHELEQEKQLLPFPDLEDDYQEMYDAIKEEEEYRKAYGGDYPFTDNPEDDPFYHTIHCYYNLEEIDLDNGYYDFEKFDLD